MPINGWIHLKIDRNTKEVSTLYTMNLPLEIVKEIKSMSKQPLMNVILYTYHRQDDETIDIQLHSHIYRIHNTIEIIKHTGTTLTRPFPVLSQNALFELLTSIDGVFFEDMYGIEMLIFTGKYDIVKVESYEGQYIITNNTPTSKLYDNPICDFRMVGEEEDYKSVFTEYVKKIWNILH